jgi:16S rRNA (uracil1498-N3)-methyltransferase
LHVKPWELPSVAQFFVSDLDVPVLEPDDLHHLERVLRVRTGETVVVSDGLGSWRSCSYAGSVGAEPSILRADGEVVSTPEPEPVVTIGFVPVKGDRPEWVVQKLTEAGVDRIVVLRSARSVVRWQGDRAGAAIERLRRVAREAAAQSRRPRIPIIDGILSLKQLAEDLGDGNLQLAQPGGVGLSLRYPAVAIGPEGGWDDTEIAEASRVVGLGTGVLRAETAAVAAGVLMCSLRDGLVAPSE